MQTYHLTLLVCAKYVFFSSKLHCNLWKHATTFVSNIHLYTSGLGGSEKAIVVDIGSDGCNSLVPLVNRECLLKKILTLLLCMARRRHYNPPSDSEIVCYRELKRHIRCVIAYHEAKGRSEGNPMQSVNCWSHMKFLRMYCDSLSGSSSCFNMLYGFLALFRHRCPVGIFEGSSRLS